LVELRPWKEVPVPVEKEDWVGPISSPDASEENLLQL